MNVLIATKPSNLEQHGKAIAFQIKKGYIPKERLVVLENSHREHYCCLEALQSSLAGFGVSYTLIDRDDEWPDPKGFAAIFAVGGDGTLLSISRSVIEHDIPIIGIKSSNTSVGYLCAGETEQIPTIVARLIAGKLRYGDCARLKAQIFRPKSATHYLGQPILNDLLFSKCQRCRHNPLYPLGGG